LSINLRKRNNYLHQRSIVVNKKLLFDRCCRCLNRCCRSLGRSCRC
jgi:hypothetical protein